MLTRRSSSVESEPRSLWARCLAAVAMLSLNAGCGSDDSDDDPNPRTRSPSGTPSLGPARTRARSVDRYLIHYGAWDRASLEIARTYPLVICHPTAANMTRAEVASIQAGVDLSDPSDDVLVLGYVSVGEDLRTAGKTDDELRNDPRFAGDRSGPRVDPRGPEADGAPLEGIDPLGAPSPGGAGFASWYLDDNSVDVDGRGDGKPDRNRNFGGCFANAGDPAWFEVVRSTTLDGPDRIAGLDEVLTLTVGRGLGCDGVFLDTIDTAAPNSFTNPSSPNPSEFEWTAPGFHAFIARTRAAYPRAVLLQNRGLFFFDPNLPHYRFHAGDLIDLQVFESYRLNSSSGPDNPHPYHYPRNRHDVAPKLMAEAARGAGFRVLSLGYAAGPPGAMSPETLVGRSTLGLDSLLEDIRVAQDLAGFRHYLTNAAVSLVNTFVRDRSTLADAEPPVWTSTHADRVDAGGIPLPPTPRAGLQEAVPGPRSITVRWDVALDKHGVRYRLYYQTQPFDFAGDPDLRGASFVELPHEPGAGYDRGTGPSTYAHQATIRRLAPGTTYHLVLRAFDGSPAAHEEKNRKVLTATPLRR